MSAQASPEAWWFAIGEAHKGDARHLLTLLLHPTKVDGHDQPVPDSWVDLPQDGTLRAAIVDMLVFGPWRTAESVASLDDLMLRTFSSGKPTLSDFEVSAAAIAARFGADVHQLAEGLGVTGETLRKRIAKHKRR